MPICLNQCRCNKLCIFLFLLFFLLSGCGQLDNVIVDTSDDIKPSDKLSESVSPPPHPDIDQSVDSNSWIDCLTNAGFSTNTADKIVERNLISWEILAENNPKELEAQLNQVAKLGKYRSIHHTLQRQPELAGLYAESLKISNDAPQKLDKVFQNPQYAWHFKNFCHLHTLDINSCLVAAEQYQKNGDVIIKLYESGRSMPAPEAYFDMNPINSKAIEVYNQFRREFILDALNSNSQDDCNEKLAYIYTPSYELREILDNDNDVRIHFLDSYLPVIKRVAELNRDSEISLLETPHIFDILKRKEGEQLLKMYGTIETMDKLESLIEKESVVMDAAVNAMLKRDQDILFSIKRFSNDKELVNLLSRNNISETDKEKILQELSQNPDGGLKRLQYYYRLSDSALNDDLHPYEGIETYFPGYGFYNVIRKKINGQEITVLEVTGVIIEGAFIVVEVVLIIPTGGASLSGTALKTAAKQAILTLSRGAAYRGAQLTGKLMAKKGIILGGKKIAKSSTSKLFGQITEQTLAKKEGINMLKFDTSPLVRTTFDKARMFGISADKFKKYTELDARIFMRPDRRVVLNFNALETLDKYKNFIIGIPKVFIRLTAENIATDKVIEKGKEFYLEYFDKEKVKQQKNISFEEYQSALWLSTATGQLNKAAETIEIEKKQEEE